MMPPQGALNIVMFSAEASPYAKVGGLGDVAGALPHALRKLGVRVILVIPAYKSIDHHRFDIAPYEPAPSFDVRLGPGSARAEIFRSVQSDIETYFVGCVDYFYRDGIYDNPATREGYFDNMERFVFYMKAGLELLPRIGVAPDIIHCHDSQTGLIPGILRANLASDPFYSGIGTVFTIHNLAYQSIYPRESLYWAGIDYRNFYPTSAFEFWGKVNFMKVGIECSDRINTVSETYAEEIQSTAEFGHGLEGVLRRRSADLTGIVNGIDYGEWNPETDPLIAARYTAGDLAGKKTCKVALLRKLGLREPIEDTPLIGIVSRLADQKGFDLIAEAIEDIATLDLQLVVLGTGQRKYQDLLLRMQALYPGNIAVRIGFDNQLAHEIEAGCDLFLMPSRYEPCGLNQLYSLRYGTVPIVRSTGGLADTVINYDNRLHTGTGFSFKNYSAQELMIAIKRALMVYSHPEGWHELVKRCMQQNWSWEASAKKYLELYESIRDGRMRG